MLKYIAKLDSLFARLLIVQLLLVLGVFAIYGKLFYADRNRSMAEVAAAHWAPVLSDDMRVKAESMQPKPLVTQPPAAMRDVSQQARFAALRPAFAKHHVVVGKIGVSDWHDEGIVWVEVLSVPSEPRWYGLTGLISVPNWPVRSVLAWGAANALLFVGAWLFARWLTRPLDRLRASMKEAERGPLLAPMAQPGPLALPEVRQLHASFQHLLGQIHQQARERELLLAGVSHDLRSPLTRIRVAADLLPDAPDVQRFKDSVVRNVQVADKLVASLIDFVWSAQTPLQDGVDINEAIQSAVDQFALDEDTLRLQWSDGVQPGQPARLAHGQTELVERMLSNLIDNALKHGRAPVCVRVSRQAGQVWLDVLDHGPGMSKEDAELLSAAFARGESSRQTPGFGLGLAIVQQVVARLNGQVSMAHEEDGAWRVRVSLPAADPLPTGGKV